MNTILEQARLYFAGESILYINEGEQLANAMLFNTRRPNINSLAGFMIGLNVCNKADKVNCLMVKFEAFAFFYENAGWSHDPKIETSEEGRFNCARSLAEAEQYYNDNDLLAVWSVDPDIDSSDFDDSDEPWEVFMCQLWDNDDNLLGSLGGVDFGRDGSPTDINYARVLVAELVLEAMHNA